MTPTLRKADVLRAVEALDDDATLEDAIDRLVLLHKVQIGLDQAAAGQSRPLAEVAEQRRLRRRERGT